MATGDETELVQTRVSPRAAKLLDDRLKHDGRSRAGWLRWLVYKELGLTPKEGQ